MNPPAIFDGQLQSPFFIYFRSRPSLSDEQILNQFGLKFCKPARNLPPFSTSVAIAECGDWTMLADDWSYRLWHLESTKPAIKSLGRTRDVFAWLIGDCDESFEFCWYQCGQLARQLTVDSPHFDDRIVRIDFGDGAPFTSDLLATDQAIDRKLRGVCSELGIPTHLTAEQLRLYSAPYESRLDPNGGIRNF